MPRVTEIARRSREMCAGCRAGSCARAGALSRVRNPLQGRVVRKCRTTCWTIRTSRKIWAPSKGLRGGRAGAERNGRVQQRAEGGACMHIASASVSTSRSPREHRKGTNQGDAVIPSRILARIDCAPPALGSSRPVRTEDNSPARRVSRWEWRAQMGVCGPYCIE